MSFWRSAVASPRCGVAQVVVPALNHAPQLSEQID